MPSVRISAKSVEKLLRGRPSGLTVESTPSTARTGVSQEGQIHDKTPWEIVKLVLDAFEVAVARSQDPKHVLYASLCVNGNKTSIRVLVFGLSEGSKGKGKNKVKKIRTRGSGNKSAHPDFDKEGYEFAIQEFAPSRDSNFLSAGLAAAHTYAPEAERKKKNEEIARIAKEKGCFLYK